jgi:hypothetical protein
LPFRPWIDIISVVKNVDSPSVTSRAPANAAPLETRTIRGASVEVAGTRATPEARAVALRLPFGGWVWTRPVAIVVEQDGQARRVPIPDPVQGARLVTIVSLGIITVLGILAARDGARRLVDLSRWLITRRQTA